MAQELASKANTLEHNVDADAYDSDDPGELTSTTRLDDATIISSVTLRGLTRYRS